MSLEWKRTPYPKLDIEYLYHGNYLVAGVERIPEGWKLHQRHQSGCPVFDNQEEAKAMAVALYRMNK